MKKYVLNTAALTIASLMAASASMASTQAFWDDASTIQGAAIIAGGNIDLLPGGGAVDSESVKQILGTGSVAGTANLVDASAVSNRLLTAPLTTDYDAFDFTAGALAANQTFTGREDVLGGRIVTAFAAGGNLQTNGVDVLGGRIVTAFGPGGNLQTNGVDVLGARIVTAFGPGGNLQTNGVDVLGPLMNAGFVAGQNLQTNGVTLLATATDAGTGGVPADILGAINTAATLLGGAGATLNTAATDVSDLVGGVLPADVTGRLDAERDAFSVDATAAIPNLNTARVQVSTAVGFTATRPVGDSVMTRLTGLDPANNTNARLAGSLSGLLSIVPADNILAQAEARRAAAEAFITTIYAGGAYNVNTAAGVGFAAAPAGGGATDLAYQAYFAGPSTRSLEAAMNLLAL